MSPRPRTASPGSSDTDQDLFRRLIADDAGALETLFHRYVDPLCSFAFAYTQTRDAAEEVVQEVFIWLWERRSAIEVPRCVPSYLHAAVRNRALNAVRDRASELRIHDRHARDGSPGVSPRGFAQPDALAEAHDLRDALLRAVSAMPLRCREVFMLTRNGQMTYAEVAGILGIAPKTVEIHMSRALAILRDRLSAWRRD